MCKECMLDYRNQLNKYKISLNYKSSLIIIARKFFNIEGAIKLYLKLKKVSKTHRSVVDLQLKDVMEIENMIPLIDDTNHQNGLEVKVKEETISLLIN